MSKATLQKKNRMIERVGKNEYALRARPLPAVPTANAGFCHICGEPVYGHPGQLMNYVMIDGKPAYSHKACRKSL